MMRRETFDDEARMQPFMDSVYDAWGYAADRRQACKKFDVEINGATQDNRQRSETIEEKYLFVKSPYNQMLVEIVQDVKSGDLGWFYYCRAQWLAWIYCPETRIDPPIELHFIRWPMLKQFVIDKMKSSRWQNFSVVTEGYGITLNLPIKFNELSRDHYYKYDGKDIEGYFSRGIANATI